MPTPMPHPHATHPVLLCDAVEYQIEAVQPAKLGAVWQRQQRGVIAEPAGAQGEDAWRRGKGAA